MWRKIALLILSSLPTALLGQIQDVPNGSLQDLAFYIGSNNPKYANAEGSRYLNDNFIAAKINKISETQWIRFNVVENTVEMKAENDEVRTLSLNQIQKIQLLNGSDIVFEIHHYRDEHGTIQSSFFESISSGKNYTLYRKERIKFVPSIPEKSSYEPAVPARFVKIKTKLYVSGFLEEGHLEEIPTKKKAFLKLFGANATSIQKFIKAEKLQWQNSEALVLILNYHFKE